MSDPLSQEEAAPPASVTFRRLLPVFRRSRGIGFLREHEHTDLWEDEVRPVAEQAFTAINRRQGLNDSAGKHRASVLADAVECYELERWLRPPSKRPAGKEVRCKKRRPPALASTAETDAADVGCGMPGAQLSPHPPAAPRMPPPVEPTAADRSLPALKTAADRSLPALKTDATPPLSPFAVPPSPLSSRTLLTRRGELSSRGVHASSAFCPWSAAIHVPWSRPPSTRSPRSFPRGLGPGSPRLSHLAAGADSSACIHAASTVASAAGSPPAAFASHERQAVRPRLYVSAVLDDLESVLDERLRLAAVPLALALYESSL